jgi:hypothetical protein
MNKDLLLNGASPMKLHQGSSARYQKEENLLKNQINSKFARNILNSHFLIA